MFNAAPRKFTHLNSIYNPSSNQWHKRAGVYPSGYWSTQTQANYTELCRKSIINPRGDISVCDSKFNSFAFTILPLKGRCGCEGNIREHNIQLVSTRESYTVICYLCTPALSVLVNTAEPKSRGSCSGLEFGYRYIITSQLLKKLIGWG